MIPYPFIRSLQQRRARHLAESGLSLPLAAEEGYRLGVAFEAAVPGWGATR